MQVNLSNRIKENIRDLFDNDGDEELCGILLGIVVDDDTYVVHKVTEVLNSAEDKKTDFEMKVGDIKSVLYPGWTIIGCIHTHTRHYPRLSENDVESIPPGYLGIMYHPHTQSLVFYNAKDGWFGRETL